MDEPVTPMMKQYFEIKSQYEDCILMYRLGDFYEMFYDDALTASPILDIALTGRNCGQEERAPMCGVPFHSVQSYIAKLIKSGHKVAICEQTEDPKNANGIVKRDVIRIITPGTANFDETLVSGENNFLACVRIEKNRYAVSFCDVSTGELITTDGESTFYENRLTATLASFKPSEIIVNDNAYGLNDLFTELKSKFDFYQSYVSEDYFDYDSARAEICKKFEGIPFDDYILGKDLCVKSVGAILRYTRETQKINLSHIRNIKYYDECDYMVIDMVSRRSLELTETMRDREKRGSLFDILDKTKTSMGKRKLKSWIDRPLISVEKINDRLMATEELVSDTQLRYELIEALSKIKDIERIIGRVVYGTCNARDCLSLRNSLSVFPQIGALLEKCQSPLLKKLSSGFDTVGDIFVLLLNAIDDEPPATIREGGIIKDGFDKELDKLRDIMKNGSETLARLEAEEKEKTGIKTLKISYNRVFGYYIEVSKGMTDRVPEDRYIRRQTLVNCERYITSELKEYENTILGATERVKSLEYEDFVYVRGEIDKNTARLQKSAEIISTADVLCSFAEVASRNNYIKPVVDNSDEIEIENGRHPIVEKALTDSLFVPNDTYLNTTDSRFSIITGPNMAGKSTYMRQNALITVMAQIGSFVPASKCRIGIVDRIFTRIGASDDLASGQSTFMVEMNEVANILKNSTHKSLIILDEVGRGTSTFDGLSIAWAMVEYICKCIGAKSLFATHYHELTVLEERIEGVKNFSVAVKRRGDDITFLRKIVRGGTDDSFGIEVAKLAGVPDEVIKRAKEVLVSIENGQGASSGEKINTQLEINKAASEKISEIEKRIMSMDISTLTPLEALNELYLLQKKVGEKNEN